MSHKRIALGICFIRTPNIIKSFAIIDYDLNFKVIVHNGDIGYNNEQEIIGACRTYAEVFGYHLKNCMIVDGGDTSVWTI